MLAQFNLDSTYRQSEMEKRVSFSNSDGWEYTTGPNEIDIQQYDGNVKTYVNAYVSYLQRETGDSTLTGTLITLSELEDLGCTISEDYSYSWSAGFTCENSDNAEWLVNKQDWWTHSVILDYSSHIWVVCYDGILSFAAYNDNNGALGGVRPVITISKDTLANL